MGLIHEHGDDADRRRGYHPGYAFAGEMAGLAVSLLNPESAVGAITKFTPAGRIARGGEAAGKAAAKAIFGEARAGELGVTAVGRRVVSEGVSNAVLAGAAATGHGVSDAIIEDKPFTSEHVASEMWKGGLFGAGIGGVGELFGRARSSLRARELIKSQGGILDAASAESTSVHQAATDAVAGWDAAVESHRGAMGALSAVNEAGELGLRGSSFLAPRREALKAAEAAGRRLRKFDLGKALAGDDAKEVHYALKALDDYGTAVSALDDVMRPSGGAIENLRPAQRPGRVDDVPGGLGVDPDEMFAENVRQGARSRQAVDRDAEMLKPGNREKYKELFGEDWQPSAIDGRPSTSMVDDLENLGGEMTPTSEVGTNPGVRAKGTPRQVLEPSPELPPSPQGHDVYSEPPHPDSPFAADH